MKSTLKLSLLAVLLAAAGVSYSMSPMGAGQCDPMMGGGRHGMNGRMDPAKMQAMQDKHHAVIKAQLKLTAAQEPAWATFTEAMKPPADMLTRQRPDPVEMAKLSTPERIDKMSTMRAQNMSDMAAAMDKRGAAAKAFYAVLTPEQQKVFDAMPMPGQGRNPGMRQGPMGGKS